MLLSFQYLEVHLCQLCPLLNKNKTTAMDETAELLEGIIGLEDSIPCDEFHLAFRIDEQVAGFKWLYFDGDGDESWMLLWTLHVGDNSESDNHLHSAEK